MLQFVRQITEKSRPRSIGPGKAAIETTSCSPENLRGSADFIDSSPGPRCCPGRRRRPVVLRQPLAMAVFRIFAAMGTGRKSAFRSLWGGNTKQKNGDSQRGSEGLSSSHLNESPFYEPSIAELEAERKRDPAFENRALDAVFFHIVFI